LADHREVRINEVYSGYRPPVNVVKVVRRLLAGVPDRYVAASIVSSLQTCPASLEGSGLARQSRGEDASLTLE